MTTQALSARGAYRSLLRATRVAFQSQSSAPPSHEASRGRTLTIVSPDDARVLSAARQEARQNFDSHRREGVDTPMQIRHAMEVAEILRHNLVQGARDEANEAGKWELRIHDEIERGDNDSIKVGGKNVKVDKPCSSSS